MRASVGASPAILRQAAPTKAMIGCTPSDHFDRLTVGSCPRFDRRQCAQKPPGPRQACQPRRAPSESTTSAKGARSNKGGPTQGCHQSHISKVWQCDLDGRAVTVRSLFHSASSTFSSSGPSPGRPMVVTLPAITRSGRRIHRWTAEDTQSARGQPPGRSAVCRSTDPLCS